MENMARLKSDTNLQMTHEFTNKKVLVTGGAGFIGSHLVSNLIALKNKIVVIDNLSSGKKESIHPEAVFYKTDVRDYKKVSATFKSENLPYKETHPLQGNHPYDASKSAADLLASTYANTYGIPIVIARFSNVYGQGDWNFSRLIPGVIKSIIKNEEFLIRS